MEHPRPNPDAAGPILAALEDSPNVAEMRQSAEQALRITARTRDGVMLAIAPAVAWVTHPVAAQCGDSEPAAAESRKRPGSHRAIGRPARSQPRLPQLHPAVRTHHPVRTTQNAA